jgi:SWI/SNF-related matrix-associated actin-dependent regulator 1 of chromatin subfamily A
VASPPIHHTTLPLHPESLNCALLTLYPYCAFHRLGQTRPVTVYRLVTRNTVDWSIWEIAQRKLKLDAAIMEGVVEEEDGEGGTTKKKAKSKKGKAGEEVQHMGAILAALLAGK